MSKKTKNVNHKCIIITNSDGNMNSFSIFSFILEYIYCVFISKVKEMTAIRSKICLSMSKDGKLLTIDDQEKV